MLLNAELYAVSNSKKSENFLSSNFDAFEFQNVYIRDLKIRT